MFDSRAADDGRDIPAALHRARSGGAGQAAHASDTAVLPEPVDESVVEAGPLLDRVQDLMRIDIEAAEAHELLEVTALCEQIAAQVQAVQLEAVAQLSRRPECAPMQARGRQIGGMAAQELGLRLCVGSRRAQNMVRRAEALAGPLLATFAEMGRGRLDPTRAEVIVDALHEVPHQVAHEVEERVLPTAPGRTTAALRRDVQRALVEVDPIDAQARCARAKQGRYVARPKTLGHGMAGIWAVLPAAQAVAIDKALHCHAKQAVGSELRIDQARADALADLILAPQGLSGVTGTGAVAGGGAARDVARSGPAGAVVGSGAAGVGVGGSAGAVAGGVARVDVRVVVPLSVLTAAARVAVQGSAAHSPEASLLTGQDVPLERSGVSLGGVGSGACAVLEGYGAITAHEAVALATHPNATWRRLVTDPVTGTVLDYGRTRYKPPGGLGDAVRSRDGTCVMPHCTIPAHSCDLDHTIAFPAGTTSHENLGALCRYHHVLKTHAGWQLAQPSPGTFVWQTPAGQQVRSGPGPLGSDRTSERTGSGTSRKSRSKCVDPRWPDEPASDWP